MVRKKEEMEKKGEEAAMEGEKALAAKRLRGLLFLMKEETKTRAEGRRREEEDRCVKSTLIISLCFSLSLLLFLGVCVCVCVCVCRCLRSPLAATPRERRRELWR